MEIVQDLTYEEARHLTNEASLVLENFADRILYLYRGRAWASLHYEDWHSYAAAEFPRLGKMIDRISRKEIVQDLADEGLKQREIASALGLHQKTVWNDIHYIDPAPYDAQASDLPRTVTQSQVDSSTESNDPEPIEPLYVAPDPIKVEQKPKLPEPQWSANELELRTKLERGETIVVSLRGVHTNIINYATQQGLYVRIDRKSQWGNPFELPADGDRTEVIKNYKEHYLPYKPSLLVKIDDLKGKALGCWCSPLPCHGDVLKEAAEK